uniref:ATP synthase F0 subunit 8 n=1 Tax=Discolomatidae sp. 1 ACP-2013 TaxID=1434484 RepID=A0A3G5FND7_9CUCU|nr:ATP synthase F0 subunit 8 [Discolomatidae sp. 1 ACP-2013]
MPQMSPMNWISLFLIFFSMYMMMNIIIYYYIIYNPISFNVKFNFFKIENYNWKW